MQVKQNLESKHFSEHFREIRKVLKKLGAQKEGVKKQKDYFFQLPKEKRRDHARMKLRDENGKMTLIYYERPDFTKNADVCADIQLYSANPELLSFLETALGVVAVVEKKREVWRKGNTVFNIDAVKDAGTIFEVEFQKNGKITRKDKELFAEYQTKLAPHLGAIVRGSNVDLVMKCKQQKHEKAR